MGRRILAGLALAVLVTFAAPQASALEKYAGGILYGSNWGCAVTAPQGWIMDQTTWAANGIYALFYAREATFGPSIPIIYVNTTGLNAATDDELAKYIAWDLGNVRSDPTHVVTEVNLTTHRPEKVPCYRVDYGGKQFETIAYLRYKDSCFLVVLATHDRAQIEPTMARYLEVIDSLRFMEKS